MGNNVFCDCNGIQYYYCYKESTADIYAQNNSLGDKEYYFGDINFDKEIDINDIGYIMSVSAGRIDITDTGNGTVTNYYNTGAVGSSVTTADILRIVADYNCDGAIDGFDVAAVDRYVYA